LGKHQQNISLRSETFLRHSRHNHFPRKSTITSAMLVFSSEGGLYVHSISMNDPLQLFGLVVVFFAAESVYLGIMVPTLL
jgi:hypothetical protein